MLDAVTDAAQIEKCGEFKTCMAQQFRSMSKNIDRITTALISNLCRYDTFVYTGRQAPKAETASERRGWVGGSVRNLGRHRQPATRAGEQDNGGGGGVVGQAAADWPNINASKLSRPPS